MHYIFQGESAMGIKTQTKPCTPVVTQSELQLDTASLNAGDAIRSIFENSPLAVFGVDSSGRVGYLNSACNDLFRLPQQASISGLHSSDLLCGGDDRCLNKNCAQCAIQQNMQSERQLKDCCLNIQQANGETVQVSITTSYFFQQESRQLSTYFSIRREDSRVNN